ALRDTVANATQRAIRREQRATREEFEADTAISGALHLFGEIDLTERRRMGRAQEIDDRVVVGQSPAGYANGKGRSKQYGTEVHRSLQMWVVVGLNQPNINLGM